MAAQTADLRRPVARAVRVTVAPVVDGHLDDVAWRSAPVIDGFVQHEPSEGQPSTEPTEVRILFDDDALYVGVRLRDSKPAEIVLGESRRDPNLDDSDAFTFVLDTFDDDQNAFVFGTNPNGVEYDGQVTQEGAGGVVRGGARAQGGSGGGFNLNWDGAWDVATSRDGEGWSAEFRIPFRTLRYGRGGPQVWGLNMARNLRRRNEQDFWAAVPRNFNLYRVSLAGDLEGLELPNLRIVQAIPYVLTSARREVSPEGAGAYRSDYPLQVGGDLKVGVTSGLTAEFTVNTDFAQVEVDEQQVNLTRFSLFFPEKRPFFLENAGTFAVGRPRSVELFFSRRIGLGPDGSPVPIKGGGRLTGKVAGLTLGVLDIQTDEVADVQPANNYAAFRLIKEFPGRSRIGGIFTNRVATSDPDDYGRTAAIDGRLGLGETAWIDGYIAGTSTPGLEGRNHALNLEGKFQTRVWDAEVGYSEVGEDFNPAMGFLERAGYRAIQLRFQRNLRPQSVPWIREMRPHTSIRTFWGFDGFVQSRTVHLDNHFEFSNGSFFSPAVNYKEEGLQEPFEISEGVVVPAGTYGWWDAAWQFNTNQGAPVSLKGGLDFGGFLSGSRVATTLTLSARRTTTLSGSLQFAYESVDLPEGEFKVFLSAFRVAYSFTPRVYLQSLVQYNSETDMLSANFRLGWLGPAGTGLFLVINEMRDTYRSPTVLMRRGVTLKYSRLLDFTR